MMVVYVETFTLFGLSIISGLLVVNFAMDFVKSTPDLIGHGPKQFGSQKTQHSIGCTPGCWSARQSSLHHL